MKKVLVLGVLLASLSVSSVFASVNVFMHGEYVDFKDAKPTTVEGRTMVPVATISKQLGIDYTWDSATQTVNFNQEDKELSLKIGDQNSFIKSARTYVPLRFIAESFGQEVDWREDRQTVVIGEDAKNIQLPQPKAYNELSDFKAVPLNGVDILKNARFRIDNRNEWGEAEEIESVYFLKQEDLPLRIANVVITDVTKDLSPYNHDVIVVSGYVLEGEMGLGTITTGLIDTKGRYRHRNFMGLNNEYHNHYISKYPDIRGLDEGGTNLKATYAGNEFAYIFIVDPSGSELDYGNFKIKDIDKIIMYPYQQGKNVVIFDNFLK